MDESSFYSIDRLVEFGLTLGVATQMANSMNAGLQAMRMPGARNPMQPNALAEDQPLFYVVLDGKSVGPLATSELSRFIAEKRVTKETYVWKPGMQNWQLAENVPEVLRLVAMTPPPVPTMGDE
ncbi:DUF4339 domain-containing protein [Collinsella sp. An307]|uniref:DUF4339 domain-containing protein n=1 Tax=Collinsella sp. An307 TaxID=1965630 RepID=UPI000B399499|nr:DUF4339 domain-containing protein [Collinsella sp. An307]OUO20507.1 hypothetical protein B5F89_05885 [Collinsella sp. An307]